MLSPSSMLSNFAANAAAAQFVPSTILILSLAVIRKPSYTSVFATSFTNTSFAPDRAVTAGRPNTTM